MANSRSKSVMALMLVKRKYIQGYKAERGCLYCPENNPFALDLHHRDPSTKMKTRRGRFSNDIVRLGWEKLNAELAKCDVVCANCHRKITAKQQGWL